MIVPTAAVDSLRRCFRDEGSILWRKGIVWTLIFGRKVDFCLALLDIGLRAIGSLRLLLLHAVALKTGNSVL